MEDEQAYSLEAKAELKRFKEALSTSIINSIENKVEFQFLKNTAEVNQIKFDDRIINFSLDNYNCLIKKKKDIYTSKYLSLWRTCYFIFNEKYKKDESS
jgi:hypothetical protein